MKVLLVEDDPITRAFLHTATSGLGLEMDQAASMQQALALAETTVYAAALLDARLPDGSGVDLLHALRQRHPGLLALAHTASTDPEQLQHLRDAGFDAAVSKPLPAADWQVAVRALLADNAAPVAHCAPEQELPPLWDDAAARKVLGGGADTLDALRGLFFGELPEQIKVLERAISECDPALARDTLHRLSASCGFVGAARLAAAIARWREDASAITQVLQAARETLASRDALGIEHF